MEDVAKIIAHNLQMQRQAKKLSLGQLSKLSGVSKVLLSQIERGNNNPTINTIWKITTALKVPYTALLDEHINDIRLITKFHILQNTHYGSDKGCRISCYFPSTPSENIEFFFMQLDPDCEHISQGHPQKSKEYIFIQKGGFLIHMDEKDYILKEGDAIVFSSDRPHIYRNTERSLSTAITANFYVYESGPQHRPRLTGDAPPWL